MFRLGFKKISLLITTLQRCSYACKQKQCFPLTRLRLSKRVLAARRASEIELLTSGFLHLLSNRLLPRVRLRLPSVRQSDDVRVLTGGAKDHVLFSTCLWEHINATSLSRITGEFTCQEVIFRLNRTSRAGSASVAVTASSLSVRSSEDSPKLSLPRLAEKTSLNISNLFDHSWIYTRDSIYCILLLCADMHD